MVPGEFWDGGGEILPSDRYGGYTGVCLIMVHNLYICFMWFFVFMLYFAIKKRFKKLKKNKLVLGEFVTNK